MVHLDITNDTAIAVLSHLANTTPALIPSGEGPNPRLVHDFFDTLSQALVAATNDPTLLPIDNWRKI